MQEKLIGANSTVSIRIALISILHLWIKECMRQSTLSQLTEMIKKITALNLMSESSGSSKDGRLCMRAILGTSFNRAMANHRMRR